MSKRTSSKPLTSWLIKRPKEDDMLLAGPSTAIDCSTAYGPPPTINTELDSSLQNEKITSPLIASNLMEFNNDIGYFVKSSLSNFTIPDRNKVHLLQLSNIPKDNFIYPFSTHSKKNKQEKRFLNRSHFEKYKWLVLPIFRFEKWCFLEILCSI